MKMRLLYGFTEAGLLGGSINNLYTYVEQFGAAKSIRTRLDVLRKTPRRGGTAAVRILLRAGANSNVFDSNLQNALYWSFANKHLGTVEAVLDASPI